MAAGTMAEVATGIRSAQGLARVNGSLIVASTGVVGGPESAGVLLRYPVLADGAVGGPETWAGTGLKQPVGVAGDALASVYLASRALMTEGAPSKRPAG